MGGLHRGESGLMKIIPTCPFGSVCEEAKDGNIYRCQLYIRTGEVDIETGAFKPGTEYDDCSLALQSVYSTQATRGIVRLQKAIEQSRNQTVQRQDALLQVVAQNAPALPDR